MFKMPPRVRVDLDPDPSLNQSSHYFVHLGENLSAPLVNPPLDRKNYHVWAKLMKCALISKNKWKSIDGSIPVPDRFDPSYDAWERCNNLIHSWIINSVSPPIAQSIIHTKLVIVVWKNLKERFAQGDLVHLLLDLQITCDRHVVLYCDNRSALHMATNPVFLERTKHLEIDCHIVREKL